MRNFTEMGYETITVIRSEYPPEIGKCLSISPVLWIQSIEKENSQALALGSERTLNLIEQTGSNFFAGGGGQPAVYTFNEPHTVLVTMSFILRKDGGGDLEPAAQIETRGSKNQFWYSVGYIPIDPASGKTGVKLSKIIKGIIGDRIFFYVSGIGKDWYITNPYDPKLSNFIDIYCVG